MGGFNHMVKKFLKLFKSGEKGFTLIELLVVVAILGVLAAVAVPNVANFMSRGDQSAYEANAAAFQSAADAYRADTGHSAYPLTLKELSPDYIRTLPTKGTYHYTPSSGLVGNATANTDWSTSPAVIP
jgi:prepilin-type N-terminal cleavage/methylation domain-containing protein